MGTYKPYEKMQMSALGHSRAILRYLDLGEKVVLLDYVKGVIANKNDLLIDLKKLEKVETKITIHGQDTIISINPEDMVDGSVLGKSVAHDDRGYTKYQTSDGRFAWVSDYEKKIFGTKARFWVQKHNLPILVTNGKKKPLGFILPVKVDDTESDSRI